jgi:O-antigen ligase
VVATAVHSRPARTSVVRTTGAIVTLVLLGLALGAGVAYDARIGIVLAGAAGLLVVVRFWWAAVALLLASQLYLKGAPVPYFAYGALAVIVCAAPLLLSDAARWRSTRGLLVVVGALCTWCVASLLWSTAPDRSVEFLIASAISLTFGVCVATLVDSEQRLRIVMIVMATLGATVAAVALGQVATGTFSRAVGGSEDPNLFALDQLLTLPLPIVLATTERQRALRLTFAAMAILISIGVLASLSRGGLIALAAVLVLLVAMPSVSPLRSSRQRAWTALALGAAAAVFVGLYSAPLVERFNSEDPSDAGGSGRVNLWRGAETAISERPVLGLGHGAYFTDGLTIQRRTPGVDFRGRTPVDPELRVHNVYLEVGAELGLVGLALFVAVLAVAIAGLRRRARQTAADGRAFLATAARGLQLSLVAFAVCSVFLSTQTSADLWILLGLAAALFSVSTRPAATGATAPAPAAP